MNNPVEEIYGRHISDGEYLMVVFHRKDGELKEFSKRIKDEEQGMFYLVDAFKAFDR